jgi:two-component system response regulator AtoC
MSKKRVLVVDDEENLRNMLTMIIQKEGYEVDSSGDGRDALSKIKGDGFDFVLCDLKMPKLDGLGLLRELKESKGESTVIMMSAYGTIDTAVEAMKLGAYDYVSKPFKTDEIILTLKKAEERERLKRENVRLKEQIRRETSFENFVGKSDTMLRIFEMIRKIADYKSTVLITGESGTGKELVARAVHANSGRADLPFVAVNCGAIPENLLESELFGHIKGAFTDATRNRIGLFEEADRGTIFLDEIGELPLILQVKLLRVLQDEEIRRVGDTKPIKVDVRVIAATTRDLEKEVREGNFRDDLFYRLNVLPISLPPLRARREDIPLLVDHFIHRFNERLGMAVQGVSPEALDILVQHSWRGNVRQLENTIERAMIFVQGDRIDVEDLPAEIRESNEEGRLFFDGTELSIKRSNRILERELIRKALQKTRGNRTRAAKLLEISHRALLYKIKEYEIDL